MASSAAPQSPSIEIACKPHCRDNHGPFHFSGQDDLVISNSRVLGHLYSTGGQHSLWMFSGHEYDCTTLKSIINTWRTQEYDRPLPHLDTFVALSQLSKALWDYQCSPKWFLRFASEVREEYWPTHFRHGGYSGTWAFIALVFGWEDVFGYASMDVPSLGFQPHLQPQPYEYREVAGIVGEKDYDDRLSLTYEFVRNKCGSLAHANRPVFDGVLECFRAQGISILTDKEANIGKIRPLGVVGLLRMFEGFLEHDAGTLNHRVIPVGNRFPHKPLLWRALSTLKNRRHSQEAEPAAIVQGKVSPAEQELLSEIERHRRSILWQFFDHNHLARDRYRKLRRDHLVLYDEGANSDGGVNIGDRIAPAEPLRQELPGSPYDFCNRSPTSRCDHPCFCHATTPPPSSSSSHIL